MGRSDGLTFAFSCCNPLVLAIFSLPLEGAECRAVFGSERGCLSTPRSLPDERSGVSTSGFRFLPICLPLDNEKDDLGNRQGDIGVKTSPILPQSPCRWQSCST